MATTRATVVTMLLAEGDTGRTVYGIFQARVRVTARGWSWSIGQAKQIGHVEVRRGEARPTYLEMARLFETATYPAWRE